MVSQKNSPVRLLLAVLLGCLLTRPSIAAGKEAPKAETRQRTSNELKVEHLHAQTDKFRWSAAVAMVANILGKEPVRLCDVAAYFERANDGIAKCCREDDDAMSVNPECRGSSIPHQATEALKWKYHFNVAEEDRPLTWDEIVDNIDHGYPVIAVRSPRNSSGVRTTFTYDYANDVVWVSKGVVRIPYEIIVITGYNAGSRPGQNRYLTVHNAEYYGQTGMTYESFKGHSNDAYRWTLSWVFQPEKALSAGKAAPDTFAVLSGPTTPPTAQIKSTIPTIPDGASKATVTQHLDANLGAVRGCYEQALLEQPPAAASASVTVAFSLENGSPSWIRTKDAQGLTAAASKCIAETVSRMRGLYPSGAKFDENQRIHFEFSKLDAGSAPSGATAETHP